jgi:2,4-dienoyl-CoA reductase-like NADH-dependent reductase (Old Yellow Enzyme family)
VITNEQVKWIRKSSGLAMSQFARLLGVDTDLAMNWELGIHTPAADVEAKLKKLEERLIDVERSVGCFRPFELLHVKLRNRLVFPPMVTRYSDKTGLVTPKILKHYQAAAHGGVGLVTLEATSVNEKRKLGGLGIWDKAHVSILKRLIDVIHEEGAAVSVQIADGIRFANLTPTDLSEDDLKTLIIEFAAGVLRALQAEADVIELHAAHSYTLADFLSKRSNRRTDDFGGGPEQRVEIIRQIIGLVRRKWEQPNVIGVRMNGEDFIAGGNTLKDACEIAAALEEAGANFIHVSAGARREEGDESYSVSRCEPGAQFPDAVNIHLPERIKQAVSIPVIGAGKIPTTELATKLIEEEKCDLVSMGRAILADYDLPNKEKAGAADQVRRCTYCNSCLRCLEQGEPVRCVLWDGE